MASLEELQSRLAMMHEILDGLRGLIERLGAGAGAAAVVPESSSDDDENENDNDSDNDNADEDAVTDLAAEIADGLRDVRDEHELLQEDLLDLAAAGAAADHDRARLKEGLARLQRELQAHHAAFRKARLGARQAIEAAQRREQQEMLEAYAHPEDESSAEDESSDEDEDDSGDSEDADDADDDDDSGSGHLHHHHHHHHHKDGHRRPSVPVRARGPPASKAASAAADITAALRQTHARIAGEVARSDFAAQTLAESSRALAELGDRYGGGGGTSGRNKTSGGSGGGDIASSLQSARHLVRGLAAAHKSDTWYLQTALYLVAATAAWLLFRRLLYGPLWLLVWWPLRTAWAATAAAVGISVRVGNGLVSGSSVSGVAMSSASPAADAASLPSSSSSDTPIIQLETGAAASATAAAAATPSTSATTDSLVEQVGRIVDDSVSQQQRQQQQQGTAADNGAAQPNRMKRMWEEDVEAAKYEEQKKEREKTQGRTKDEL